MKFLSYVQSYMSADKTAKKAENHGKEGPINATVGKSGLWG